MNRTDPSGLCDWIFNAVGCFSQAALNVVQPKIRQLANYLDQSTSTASQCTAAAGPGTSFDDAVSDVSSIFRVPDYVSVDIDINAISVGAIPIGDIPIPIGVGGGVVVSDTRYGGVFIEPIASIGTEGPTFQERELDGLKVTAFLIGIR